MLTKDDKITLLRTLREGDLIICIKQFTNSTGVYVKLGVYVVLAVIDNRTGLRIQEMINAVEYGFIVEINEDEFVEFFTTAKDYESDIEYYRNLFTTRAKDLEQEEEVIEENRDSKKELAEDAIDEFTTVLKPLLLYISMWKQKGINLEFSSHNPCSFSVSYRDYEGFRKSITRFIKLDNNLDVKVENTRASYLNDPMTKIEDGVDLYN